jgi:hypothetical protein
MAEVKNVVDDYIAAWNTADADERRTIVERVWTEDGTYVDPLMNGDGPDAIVAMIGAAREQFPGHRFELALAPDVHHDRVRFGWKLLGPSGPAAAGIDFATVADDGRLRDVTGFLEPAA